MRKGLWDFFEICRYSGIGILNIKKYGHRREEKNLRRHDIEQNFSPKRSIKFGLQTKPLEFSLSHFFKVFKAVLNSWNLVRSRKSVDNRTIFLITTNMIFCIILQLLSVFHCLALVVVKLGVWSHGLMVQSFLRSEKKHYGTSSSWECHDHVRSQDCSTAIASFDLKPEPGAGYQLEDGC